MRLADNFYRVDKIEPIRDNSFDVTVTIAKEHPIYKGHFPEQGVVPGVCTLTIIKECLALILKREVFFAAIKECKYLSALLPQEDIKVIIHISISDLSKVNVVIDRIDDRQPVLKLRADINDL